MSFSSLPIGADVIHQLETLSDSGRIPHAVIFESRDKALAESAAKELAAAFLCESDGMRPCGVCRSCRKVRSGVHPDVYTVVTTGGKQATGVGEIRQMISECYIKPNEARGKVCFIFDKMTVEAQNALLKILEEPPQNVQFVIITEKSTLLLKTVLSRSTLFKLTAPASRTTSDEAFDTAVEIARAVPLNIELPLLGATSALVKNRETTSRVLEILADFFAQALEAKYIDSDYPDYITEITRMLRKSSIVKLFDVVSQAQEMLSHNCNMNVLATWLCANIRESRH